MCSAIDVEQLHRDGYAVAEQVVPRSIVDALLGLAGALPVWGHQAQWDARQHPAVHEVFTAAYGTDRLWVSLDGMSLAPPGHPALPIHWDLGEEPRHMDRYQGVLYLTDVEAKRAAFCAVPELYGRYDEYADPSAIDPGDAEIVPVPGRAGDMVVWHAKLAHGVAANTAGRPRVVQYIGMQPPGFWRGVEQERADRIELHESGRANPHYRHRPGHDRVEPWPPATLTPLGRRLLGADPWP